MSLVTSQMGLIAWDLGTDSYSHTQLAQNFQKIDIHDHTTGKGKQIPTAGLADGSVATSKIIDQNVTSAKIADNAINAAKIVDGSVGTAELANESVTNSKIAAGAVTKDKLDGNIIPIGTVISWYRPNGSVPIPTGWEICDGRAWSSIPNGWGQTSGTIPDLRNKFILGAATSGVGSGTSMPPDIGQVGGSHTKDLSHSHAVEDHSHWVGSHDHPISSDGSHKHCWPSEVWDGNGNLVGTQLVDAVQRGSAVKGAEGSYQALYIPGLNRNQYHGESWGAPMETVGGHSHGGATGANGGFSSGGSAPNTLSALPSATDVRPAYVGLIFLMRVL